MTDDDIDLLGRRYRSVRAQLDEILDDMEVAYRAVCAGRADPGFGASLQALLKGEGRDA